MTSAQKRQVEHRLSLVLERLHEWKLLRQLKQFGTFSKETVDMEILKCEIKADELTDQLCEVQ